MSNSLTTSNRVTLPLRNLQQLRDDIASRIETLKRMEESLEPIDAAEICGAESAKRALTIVVAGNHSIWFIGEPESGKSMLRRVASSLEHYRHFESPACPCGWRSSITRDCVCDAADFERYMTRFQPHDIVVQTCPPTARELNSRLRGTSTAVIRQRVEATKTRAASSMFESKVINGELKKILAQVKSELGLTADRLEVIVSVARTIATLERFETTHAPHLLEAINYQMRF